MLWYIKIQHPNSGWEIVAYVIFFSTEFYTDPAPEHPLSISVISGITGKLSNKYDPVLFAKKECSSSSIYAIGTYNTFLQFMIRLEENCSKDT